MTVTYSAEVATSRGFGCFWKLLFRWRGSIYKLLWPDLSLYLFVYYFLSIIYRFTLSESQRRYFEKVSIYCKTYGDLIPVSFILGFYVSIVVKRWWDSFNCIPWPDTLAFFVSAYVHGQDERGRLMRRTIMRYANLAFVITLTCISPCVKKRFPTMDHLVEAGILLPNEKKIMEQLKTSHSTYWMPLVWSSSIAIRARKEGRIRDDFALNTLIDAIAHYRSLCGGLFNYDWVSIPLVYTQVVTLVVYTFFLATLMGRQYLDPAQKHPGYEVDLYIPIFNFLQFFFYMGWLKVAETLVNPFGEDDDDFEVNWVIDRDIQVSYLIVDEMHQEHPELIKDQYWDEVLPDLPYTAAAMPFYTQLPEGSAANLVISAQEAEFIPLETLEEDDEELENVKVNGIPFTAKHPRNFLASNLSGSSCSGLSRLGRSFHPRSYERKGILNLMHDFLRKESSNKDMISRESSVRKNLYKTQSKDSTRDPSLCDTSGPPSPEEYGDRMQRFNDDMFFQDDIFHLSDLSLADSRGTGAVQSPGIFSNAQLSDFFSRMKPERPYKISLTKQGSTPKVMSPKSDVPDDESTGTPSTGKKKRTNSLKHFFKPSKYKGSQKSLFDSLRRDYTASQMISPSESAEDSEKIENEKFENNIDEDPSVNNSDEEVTVREAHPIPQNMSKSTVDIGHKSSMSEPIPFERPRKSLPHVVFHNSPENLNSGKLVKEPSTSTLVPGEGSLENTPPSAAEKESGQKTSGSEDTKNAPDDTDASSIENSPTKTSEMSLLQRRLHSKLKPSRTISLNLSGKKEDDARSLTGVQKFRKKHRGFFRTFSQPVSPTEAESPVGFPPPHASFFKRRHSKGSDAAPVKSSSRGSLFGRRHSRGVELSGATSATQGFLSRRSSKEGEASSSAVRDSPGGLLSRRHSKEVATTSPADLQNEGHCKDAVSSSGGLLSKRHSKEVESPSATTSSVGELLNKRHSKDVESPVTTSSTGGVFINHLSKDIESPRGSTSSLKSLFNRRMSKDGKILSPLQIQANPQIIISPNFVDEKNQKNKEISDV